jgi:hypothetical protein
VVQLTKDGDQNKPLYLRNLSGSQMEHYKCLGELGDIEESILNVQKATQLTENGHPEKTVLLNNLGISQ